MNHPDPKIEALLQKLVSPKLAVIDLSLDRIHALLGAFGNPERRLPPVVHVAGTNGKGSLVAYLTAILEAAGLRVHRYISPHLVRFNERIRIAGRDIGDAQLLDVLARVEAHGERHPVTFFEATTAAAFLAFAEEPADIVLLETGLGGRLDATNVVASPLLTAITPISMDHMDYLGDTLAGIAAEKAGILKQGVACVVGPQVPEVTAVLEKAAAGRQAPLFRHGREWSVEKTPHGFRYRDDGSERNFPLPSLAGDHQIANAGTAVACTRQLHGFKVSDAAIAEGITKAVWPARLQRLEQGALAKLMPKGSELWLDGGHNPGAGEVLAAWARMQTKPVHLLCGMLKTKDTRQFLAPLAPHVRSLTAIAIEGEPLGQNPEAILQAAVAAGIQKTRFVPGNNFKSMIESIVSDEQKEFILLVCGSLYLAGNILWQNG